MQAVRFHPKAREAIRAFPAAVRDQLGKALYLLQQGETLAMPLSRPMPVVAPGVAELRLRDGAGQYRSFYLVKKADEVLVLHAFVKKTQATPAAEIERARARLKEMLP